MFTSEIASAPLSSAARASGSIALTFGDSFTITGRRATRFTAVTTSASSAGSLEKYMPPWLVLGQDTFSS